MKKMTVQEKQARINERAKKQWIKFRERFNGVEILHSNATKVSLDLTRRVIKNLREAHPRATVRTFDEKDLLSVIRAWFSVVLNIRVYGDGCAKFFKRYSLGYVEHSYGYDGDTISINFEITANHTIIKEVSYTRFH